MSDIKVGDQILIVYPEIKYEIIDIDPQGYLLIEDNQGDRDIIHKTEIDGENIVLL